MRAGLLREPVDFMALKEEQSPSGFVKKDYQIVYSCKANKKKNTVALGDEMNASEAFKETTIVLQVRYHPAINEDMHIRYNGSEYDIKLIDPQTDHSYLITCKKINK